MSSFASARPCSTFTSEQTLSFLLRNIRKMKWKEIPFPWFKIHRERIHFYVHFSHRTPTKQVLNNPLSFVFKCNKSPSVCVVVNGGGTKTNSLEGLSCTQQNVSVDFEELSVISDDTEQDFTI